MSIELPFPGWPCPKRSFSCVHASGCMGFLGLPFQPLTERSKRSWRSQALKVAPGVMKARGTYWDYWEHSPDGARVPRLGLIFVAGADGEKVPAWAKRGVQR